MGRSFNIAGSMLVAVFGLSAVIGSTSGCLFSTCSFGNSVSIFGDPGKDTIAVRARVPEGVADEVSASYRGTLTNRSPEDCAFAIYEFDEPPNEAEIQRAVVGGSPGDHPGGGVLIHHGLLPGAGEREFVVPITPPGEFSNDIPRDEFTAPSLDTTVVFTFCEGSNLDTNISFDVFACDDGNGTPQLPQGAFDQLW